MRITITIHIRILNYSKEKQHCQAVIKKYTEILLNLYNFFCTQDNISIIFLLCRIFYSLYASKTPIAPFYGRRG